MFYWAWAKSEGSASIALHPHKGFEIASYVLSGELGHRDTGGNSSRIGAGGVQVMQTGSGISHQEETFGPAEFFQIWFEPDLRNSLRKLPEYHEASDDELPVRIEDGVNVKPILGDVSPIQIETNVVMEHWTLSANTSRELKIDEDESLAVVVIAGDLAVTEPGNSQQLRQRDFVSLKVHASRKTSQVVSWP